MVEPIKTEHSFASRLLLFLALFLAGGVIAQTVGYIAALIFINDSQAAGMLGNLIMQNLVYYFLACAFVILSLANILIKRGSSYLKSIRLPSLVLMLALVSASFLLIPRMDYLRETALLDGMPVMISPLAQYFSILNGLLHLLMIVQIASSVLVAWRLGSIRSPQMSPNSRD